MILASLTDPGFIIGESITLTFLGVIIYYLYQDCRYPEGKAHYEAMKAAKEKREKRDPCDLCWAIPERVYRVYSRNTGSTVWEGGCRSCAYMIADKDPEWMVY